MLEVVISLIVIAIVVIAIFYIISIWIYKRAPSNMGFIRTGFLGTKICLGKGAIVLPVFHEISWVSLETIKFAVSRAREQARRIKCLSNIRQLSMAWLMYSADNKGHICSSETQANTPGVEEKAK